MLKILQIPSSRLFLTVAATGLCALFAAAPAYAQSDDVTVNNNAGPIEDSFARIQEEMMKRGVNSNNVTRVRDIAPVTSTPPIDPAGSPQSLVISANPLVEEVKDSLYSNLRQTREIAAEDIIARSSPVFNKTLVGQEIDKLEAQHTGLREQIRFLTGQYDALIGSTAEQSADYHATIATISTQLQSGTTPGNPRLINKIEEAQSNLLQLSDNIAAMNIMATEISKSAAEAGYLNESVMAAYTLFGATEEDHIRLAQTEDSISNSVVVLERMLNNISDSITRNSAYLSSERNNLRTLSMAVNKGDLYGKSFANRLYNNTAPPSSAAAPMASSMAQAAPRNIQPQQAGSVLSGPRPLVKIRFTDNDVDYEQAVYMAVNEALQRYPNASFDVIGVHPSTGNAAQIAIESTRARRNADRVLRTLTDMGLSLTRIDTGYDKSADATSSEVHIFIK